MFIAKEKFEAVELARDNAIAQATKLTEDVQALGGQTASLTKELETANQSVEALQVSVTEKEEAIANLTTQVASLTQLPGAKQAAAISKTEAPDAGAEVDENAKMASMTISERIAYLKSK